MFSFSNYVDAYASLGHEGVDIPDYVCDNPDAEISQPDVDNYPTMYIISNSNADEMNAFVASFSSNWEDEQDSYGDHHLYFGGELQPGESCPYIYVGDYTQESFAGIMVQFSLYTEPVPNAAFPLEEVNTYLGTYAQYGFTISQDEANAISALSTSFVVQIGTDDYGYPICQVQIGGEVASEVEAILLDTITAAGFEYDSDYGAYYNSSYWAIAFIQAGGNTYLIFN